MCGAFITQTTRLFPCRGMTGAISLYAVVHVEFTGVYGHTIALYFLFFQLDETIDGIVIKYTAFG
jgi:hypothetical protein